MNQDQLFSVEGRGIVVTGAASGIGRAVAAGLAERGARVTALDRDGDGLAALKSECAQSIRIVAGDAADEATITTLVEGHLAEVGRLDAVFAIAGVAGAMKATAELGLDEFETVMRINVHSAFLLARAAIPVFRERGWGRIVLTSSVWGVRGEPNAPVTPYATSKGAVANLTKQLAVELAADGITVNAILPGAIATRIADGFYDDAGAVAGLVRHVPAGTVVGPEAAVGPAVFLASEASRWVTGHLLPVDGGYLAM
jgi:NAD(P)-dependent dehydrogenase (short-subunit alcohol dehydrogenase family)